MWCLQNEDNNVHPVTSLKCHENCLGNVQMHFVVIYQLYISMKGEFLVAILMCCIAYTIPQFPKL